MNLGSAVILPEVFLKALTLVRNLGYRVKNFTTVNMDFIPHYRPLTNVVRRPTLEGGKGFHLTGHHEIMFPLLTAAILEEIIHRRGALRARATKNLKNHPTFVAPNGEIDRPFDLRAFLNWAWTVGL